MDNETTSLIIPDLRIAIESKDIDEVRNLSEALHPGDIANLFEILEIEESLFIFNNLEGSAAVQAFELLEHEEKINLLENANIDMKKLIMNEMSDDDRADFFQDLELEAVEDYKLLLNKKEQTNLDHLLSYEEDVAGGIMTTDYVGLRTGMTLHEAINELRKNGTHIESVYYEYVLDNEKKLVGVITLKDLILNNPDELIENIMVPRVIFVYEDEDQETVATIFKDYNFISLPVVSREGKLVGIVTVDDIIDIMEEEETEDVHKMHAIIPIEETYTDASCFDLFKKRIPWVMMLLLVGNMLCGSTVKAFEHTLTKIVALSFFMPMLLATAGNVGAQSASMIIRALAVGEVSIENFIASLKTIWYKEFIVAFLMGFTLSLICLVQAYMIVDIDYLKVGFTVGISLFIATIYASLIGGSLPIIAQKIGFDPAVMAGPLITTVVDVSTLIIYFQTARLVFQLN